MSLLSHQLENFNAETHHTEKISAQREHGYGVRTLCTLLSLSPAQLTFYFGIDCVGQCMLQVKVLAAMAIVVPVSWSRCSVQKVINMEYCAWRSAFLRWRKISSIPCTIAVTATTLDTETPASPSYTKLPQNIGYQESCKIASINPTNPTQPQVTCYIDASLLGDIIHLPVYSSYIVI